MGGVRAAHADDAGAIAAIYAPYVLETIISFETEAPTPMQMASRIEGVRRSHPFLVWEQEREVIGYAYASPHRERAAYRWSADVSVYVRQGSHGTGIGRALYTELLQALRQREFHSAFAGIALPNEASVGLHEAMGFTQVGVYSEVGFKFGAWRDVGWWQLALQRD